MRGPRNLIGAAHGRSFSAIMHQNYPDLDALLAYHFQLTCCVRLDFDFGFGLGGLDCESLADLAPYRWCESLGAGLAWESVGKQLGMTSSGGSCGSADFKSTTDVYSTCTHTTALSGTQPRV